MHFVRHMYARWHKPPANRLASLTRRAPFVVAALVAAVVCTAICARAESLKITSVPAGASVEMNGTLVGQTPLSLDYPGDYFHKPHTALGERLGHAIVIRVYKSGYITKSMTLSDGPIPWVGLGGKQHGTYFVLRAKHFEFALNSTGDPSEAVLGDEEKPGPMRGAHRDVSASAARTNANAAEAAADTGTAHHKFLQHISLEKVGGVGALETEAGRLEQSKVLSADERTVLDLRAVAACWSSAAGKEIRQQAANVRRELAFTAKFSPAELSEITGSKSSPDLADEFVVVQGVADLAVLLPQEIWLVDFKTDDVRPRDLDDKVATYRPQLQLYAAALEKIYSRKVTLRALHFLAVQKTEKI